MMAPNAMSVAQVSRDTGAERTPMGALALCSSHSAIRYVTPDQRGLDGELLKQREAVYEAARQRNLSDGLVYTKLDPVTEVWLNPLKEHQAEKPTGLKAA